jgi:two-component system response regulator YesN
MAGNIAVLFCDMQHNEEMTVLERLSETLGDSYITLSKTVYSLFEVKEAFSEARNLFGMSFLFRKNGVITEKVLTESANRADPQTLINALPALIEINNTEKISETLTELRSALIAGKFSPENIKLICIGAVKDIVKKIGNTSEKKDGLPSDEEIDSFGSLNCLSDIISKTEALLCRLSDNFYGNTTKSNIEKVVKYINDNYASELRLENLAVLFGYNSAYLGKVFSRRTGENFNNYLDSIRIAEAKRLLETDTYKVFEVAKMVGFQNINYFHNKFKKLVGVSPLAYKKNS